MKKINVVGTSGSGKSTFGRLLAKKLNCTYLEMDAIFWKPDWTESSDEEFFANLKGKLSTESWVLDGNYNRTVPTKWANVDTVVWLDYSFTRTLYQAIKRAFISCFFKQELWEGTGNKESFKKTFFSKKSIILWTISNYQSNRIRYERMLSDPKFSHIEFVRISSPKMAKGFIEKFDQ
ncbi:adenylate kinase [Vibrio nigripulchritudo]|uniref:shikimate kinase n=1 Tax=Vibrio nigripulchritudo TaxID=28173 RepID=UPI00190D4085|nr:shikimate kinase [Vibrio nigripulchritudo]BCL69280.1 adenylate kinase [Vibrio nigripulchritudo]BDU30614.1 adenylate kinase [Vibrio nigripulchritudo]